MRNNIGTLREQSLKSLNREREREKATGRTDVRESSNSLISRFVKVATLVSGLCAAHIYHTENDEIERRQE